MPVDLDQALGLALSTARAAGDLILTHDRPLPQERVTLKGVRDPVTEADLQSERLIVDRLRAAGPPAAIVAEEAVRDAATEGLTWYVDPLDGTVNFSQAHPFFCVSIALYDGPRPLVGVVHAPRLRETFAARAGGGATLNGTPLRVSGKSRLIDGVLATGFAYGRNEVADDNVGHFTDLVLKVRDLRRAGSAALDLAYTAAGRLDGYWEPHLNAWDVAAGALLVREAGGLVSDMRGGEGWLHGRSIVAAGPALHPLLLGELARG